MAYRMQLRAVAASVAFPPPGPDAALFLFALSAAFASSALSGCTPPRAPEVVAAQGSNPEGSGAELTCDERMRAQGLCHSALRQRCDSRAEECETSCNSTGVPKAGEAASVTETTFVTDIDATRCQNSCKEAQAGCIRSIAPSCPAKCD